MNPSRDKIQGLVTASGLVHKGQGGPKNFESEEPAAPTGRKFKIIKKPKQIPLDRDDDFPDDDGKRTPRV